MHAAFASLPYVCPCPFVHRNYGLGHLKLSNYSLAKGARGNSVRLIDDDFTTVATVAAGKGSAYVRHHQLCPFFVDLFFPDPKWP